MGAHDISFELKGKVKPIEIDKAFKAQKEYDENENGHQSGYSGDFQTVNSVDFHLDKVFNNHDEAMEYCLEKAQKWSTVIAVYYNQSVEVKSKRIDALTVKIEKAIKDTQAIHDTPLDRSKPFKTCFNCKSKISTAHMVKDFSKVTCPVCGMDMRPKAFVKKLTKLRNKRDSLIEKRKALILKEEEKQAAKGANINTLVAGWGAS